MKTEICRSFFHAFLSDIAIGINKVLMEGWRVKMIIDHSPANHTHCDCMVIFEKEVEN